MSLRLSMLKHSGCPTQSFADSNGVLDEIFTDHLSLVAPKSSL